MSKPTSTKLEPTMTALRERAKELRNLAPDPNVPYLVPSTKETMALAMASAASEMEHAVDAIEGLERENAGLRERLAVLDNRGESMHIGEATVTIAPTLDWTGVARELRAIADTLAGDAE